jgi:hypothetical protein
MELDLWADLNSEDDEGLNWTMLSKATSPEDVRPGAILKAGTETAWSWVRIEAVDDDGQVHFARISDGEPRQGKIDLESLKHIARC